MSFVHGCGIRYQTPRSFLLSKVTRGLNSLLIRGAISLNVIFPIFKYFFGQVKMGKKFRYFIVRDNSLQPRFNDICLSVCLSLFLSVCLCPSLSLKQWSLASENFRTAGKISILKISYGMGFIFSRMKMHACLNYVFLQRKTAKNNILFSIFIYKHSYYESGMFIS